MISGRFAVTIAAAASLLCVDDAGACPFCPTETGERIYAQIFGPDFLSNVFLALLPGIVVSMVAGGLHLFYRGETALSSAAATEEEEKPWKTAPIVHR